MSSRRTLPIRKGRSRRNAVANVVDITREEIEDLMSDVYSENLENDTDLDVDGDVVMSQETNNALGIYIDPQSLVSTLDFTNQDIESIELPRPNKRRAIDNKNSAYQARPRRVLDFFGSMSQAPELLMELAHHLSMADFISLYAISKDFHETVNGHMSHIMKSVAAYQAPGASRIFAFNNYSWLCIPDPVGRVLPGTDIVRRVPSLQWLQMVVHRQKVVRDILACMAREGHRMPKTMSMSLKKMWVIMDMGTSSRRVQSMHNEEYWADFDIYNIMMFMIKLEMCFNDPVEGPADDGLKKLMLGQRGLTPLAKLLKRTAYTESVEIIQCALRYAYKPSEEHSGMPIFGVPPTAIGRGHLEGWGLGKVHLYRMDELIPREACRRNLALDKHMMNMLLWGYVDPVTKKDIVVTDEEMYMSDDEDDSKLTVANGEDVDSDGDISMLEVENGEWETDDEDMAHESLPTDHADAGTIGASGFRREDSESEDEE